MFDTTYCNSPCKFRARCARHYTHHVAGEPGATLWMAEFRTSGRGDTPCGWFVEKEKEKETK